MLLHANFLKSCFAKALTYIDYIATGSAQQQTRWMDVYRTVRLTDEQEDLLAGFSREMNILVLSSTNCGDCVEQGPMLARIAQACPEINLRFIDRDTIPELRDNLIINLGTRVPVAVFMAEDFAPCAIYGDRSLTRYRALAQRQLGITCPSGLFIPDAEELSQTCRDWLNEVERVQLMLRLSTRFRQKYQD